jgi:hypothetical protein
MLRRGDWPGLIWGPTKSTPGENEIASRALEGCRVVKECACSDGCTGNWGFFERDFRLRPMMGKRAEGCLGAGLAGDP